jgi:hypothetical protein
LVLPERHFPHEAPVGADEAQRGIPNLFAGETHCNLLGKRIWIGGKRDFGRSFRLFISRRELSEYHRKNYSNIVAIVKKMLSLSPHDEKGRVALREKIKTTEVLTEREWLLGQLG